MKFLIATSLLLAGLTTHAGPFVSGGTALRLRCSDETLQLDITVLGASGGGNLINSNTEEEVELNCLSTDQAVPTMMDTKLKIICSSENNQGHLKIYRNTMENIYWALVVNKTKNGVPDPHSLNCK